MRRTIMVHAIVSLSRDYNAYPVIIPGIIKVLHLGIMVTYPNAHNRTILSLKRAIVAMITIIAQPERLR